MAVSGNVIKQRPLPQYNGTQFKDETGKEDFAAMFPPEVGNTVHTKDHDDRCAGHQILYCEESGELFSR
jgi:hypothetical protein